MPTTWSSSAKPKKKQKAALEKLREWMDGAGLTLHPDKTRTADLNRPLPGWFGYFKHVKAGQLGEIDGWIRMRLRSILGKRRGLEGRGLGGDHQRWPNRYFKKLGLFCLLDARETEFASLRNGANH